jgi:glycosyltransferase involved in cell wall biosynthesis
MLAKCIVVATDVGWTKEITNKWDFFLIKPWSVDALRNWLEQALKVVWKKNGASYQNVKEKFDWKVWVKQYLDVYNKL